MTYDYRTASWNTDEGHFLKGLLSLGDDGAWTETTPSESAIVKKLEKKGLLEVKETYRFDHPYRVRLTSKGFNEAGKV